MFCNKVEYKCSNGDVIKYLHGTHVGGAGCHELSASHLLVLLPRKIYSRLHRKLTISPYVYEDWCENSIRPFETSGLLQLTTENRRGTLNKWNWRQSWKPVRSTQLWLEGHLISNTFHGNKPTGFYLAMYVCCSKIPVACERITKIIPAWVFVRQSSVYQVFKLHASDEVSSALQKWNAGINFVSL